MANSDHAPQMVYAEHAPCPQVADAIADYWSFFSSPEKTAEDIIAPPDGCIALVWVLGEHKRYLVGPYRHSRRMPVWPGQRLFGLRFWPGAATALLAIVPPVWRDKAALTNAFPGFARLDPLTRSLDRCRTPEEAVQVADEQLSALLAGAARPNRTVMDTTARIVASRAKIKVSELAALAGISVRQLHRRYYAAAGLSPQEFIRIWRWRNVAAHMAESGANDWATLAAEYGLSDQSHLVREYRQVSGLTPGDYARLIARIDWSGIGLTERRVPGHP